MQSSSRLAVSATDLNMDVIGDEHLKNKRKGSTQWVLIKKYVYISICLKKEKYIKKSIV